jgi:hypothetical protein
MSKAKRVRARRQSAPKKASEAPATDPIYRLIAAHKCHDALHTAACEAGAQDWDTEQSCLEENAAFDVLLDAAATTLRGLLAKLTYLRKIGEGEEAWMIRDREERVALPLIKSCEASIAAIIAGGPSVTLDASPTDCRASRGPSHV